MKFRIQDGRPLLFYNQGGNNTVGTWETRPAEYRVEADASWPEVAAQ